MGLLEDARTKYGEIFRFPQIRQWLCEELKSNTHNAQQHRYYFGAVFCFYYKVFAK